MSNVMELEINKVSKSFNVPSKKGKLNVLDSISLNIEKGEIIALLGPSGCGKSTLLNIIAGFEKPDEGNLLFMGKPIMKPSTERAVVFQSSVLFPWLTVKQNIIYGLKLKKDKSYVMEEKFNQYMKLMGLEGFENYYPNQLSGGMQQRVALARVFILEPRLLLMDEPFAALDAQTRMAMQQLLLTISEKLKPTILFVTHDTEEALILSDKVYVMSKLPGRIIHELKVPFGRTRNMSMIGEEKFINKKKEILDILFET